MDDGKVKKKNNNSVFQFHVCYSSSVNLRVFKKLYEIGLYAMSPSISRT
jgi:hypothetical protein